MADRPRATRFAPTVGAGLGTAALAAVCSAKPWFRLGTDRPTTPGLRPSDTAIDMPLALALSLVVLAGWGAVLVTRGPLRRVVAALALVASLGVVACVVAAPFVLPDDLRDRVGPSFSAIRADQTGWYLTAAVAAALATVVLGYAWRLVPRWPTMSSRYDAPGAQPAADAPSDLWKALDQGLDPTEPPRPPSP
jgi:uncharacterized membrane protein (TIGR02234 family)